jgi:homocysteine S-methyltransferase
MDTLRPFIEEQGFIVLDGGLATELENSGESLNDPLWSAKILLSDPRKIGAVHESYFAAGADVAITASYQATFAGLANAGLSQQQAEKVIRSSVTVAQEARDRFWNQAANRTNRVRPLVAASIGPYGAFLHDGSEYRGDYKIGSNALKDFHRERLRLLAASGAELLACESIPSIVEAQALIALLQETPNATAWLSFTCKDGSHISDGTPFASAVALAISSPAIQAVGLNCTAPSLVNSLLEKASALTDKPLVVYPNSGEIYDAATCTWQSLSEAGMIEDAALGWYERGARLIGGCCRTTPQTIRGIRHALSAFAPLRSGSSSPSDRSPSR